MIKLQATRRFWLESAIVTLTWLILLALAPLGWGIDWPVEFWFKQFVFALILTLTYFINSYWLVPLWLSKHKVFTYFTIIILVVIAGLIINRAIEHWLDLPRLIHEIIRPGKPYHSHGWFRFDFPALLLMLLALGVSSIMILLRQGQENALAREELEKERISAELSYLKAQINPHFFFNTLNNIYSLTMVNLEAAQQSLHMLSSMMRYVLYDAQKELTRISQEIHFIENYIALMKLRLSDKVTVNFHKPENPPGSLIAPMMLLPFIENAFKHGISSQQSSVIDIKIECPVDELILEVSNPIIKNSGLKMEGSGIGLTNTQRRLELLYPGRYHIDIHKENEIYKVHFKIKI